MSSHDSQPAPPTSFVAPAGSSRSHEEERFEDSYRAISRAAVAGLILAVLGLFGFWFKLALAFALIGLIFSQVARANLVRYPEELTGGPVAMVAILLS